MARYSLIWLAVVAILAGAAGGQDDISGASAQANENEPQASYDSAFSQAQAGGRMILFYYYAGDASNEARRAGQMAIQALRGRTSPARGFVVKSIKITGEDERHRGYVSQIEGDSAPYWVLAKPDGTFVDGGGFNTIGADARGPWREAIVEAARNYPPIGPRDRQAIARALSRAEDDFEDERYARVASTVERLRLAWYPDDLAADCEAFCETFDAYVDGLLADAKALSDAGQTAEATEAYQAIIDTFGRESVPATQAREAMEALAADDTAVEAAEGAGDEPDDLPEAPAEPEADSSDVADAPDDAGDPEEDAAAMVRMARMYYGRDMIDKAKDKLQECIAQYPDTQAAQAAQSLLEQR